MFRVRRFLAGVVFLCLAAQVSVSSAAVAQTSNPSAPAVETLANGLEVVVVEQHATPLVRTALWYRFGSSDETRGKTGLAHALEHMMFRGTPSLSYAGLTNFSGHFGAIFNGATTEDATRFDFEVPSSELETTLRIEADRMQHLSLDPKAWAVERGAVLSEIDNDTSNPLAHFLFAVRAAAATDPGYRLPAFGLRADVERATVDDLRRYYEAWYAPNNAVLTIVGDVEPQAAFAAAGAAFGGVARRAVPARSAAPFVSPAATQTVTDQGDFPFEVVDLAYVYPGYTGSVDYDMQNLAYTIADQRSAFYKDVVLSGIALAGFTLPELRAREGTLHALYIVAPGHTAAEVQQAFQSALAGVLENGPPERLVGSVRTRLIAEDTYARDSLERLSGMTGDLYASGLTIAEDVKRTAAVSPASIRAAAQKYMKVPAVIGHFQPRSSAFSGLPANGLSGGVSDNFAARLPEGESIAPEFVQADMRKIVNVQNRIDPVVFTVNGIRVLVQQVKGNGTVVMRGELRSSPNFDPAGKEGLGEAVATLLNYGSANVDYETMRQELGSLGADLSLGSSLGARCYTKDFPRIVDLMAGSLRTPAFPQKFVVATLRQQAQSASRARQIPEYRFERTYQELLLPKNDPELREPTVDSVEAIKRDDILAYARTYVRPEFLTFAVVGDVDPAAVRRAFERAFGTWRAAGSSPDPSLPAIPLPQAATRNVTTPSDSVAVRIGGVALARGAPDYDALAVASIILGGTFDSRLMTEMREKRGLVYSVASDLSADVDRGTIKFDFSAAPANVARARAILVAQLARLRSETPGEFEVNGAKGVLVARAFRRQDATTAIADDILALGIDGLPPDYYQTLAQRYDAITPEAVRDAAKKYLNTEHLIEVDRGPSQ